MNVRLYALLFIGLEPGVDDVLLSKSSVLICAWTICGSSIHNAHTMKY